MTSSRAATMVSAVLLILLSDTACTVGPDYHAPAVAGPSHWWLERGDVPGHTDEGSVETRWWRSFGDPELCSLVARLARQNIDLQTAAERIRQSVDQLEIARSQGLPHVDERSFYRHERQSPSGFISLVQPAPYAPLDYDIWSNGLTASWELDLFGRVRRAVEARRADTVASVEARHAVALDALADLAGDYLRLRGSEALLRIARSNLAVSTRNADLVSRQFKDGVATTLAVAQARAEQESTAATVPPLQREAARLTNAIGFLMAEPPRALEVELDATDKPIETPTTVPIGLPMALVARRPDVREAEARLHAATAETGVAVANFYPDVSLTGQFEDEGRQFVNAFSLPARAFQVGPGVDLPLFEGGRLVGTLRLRRSEQREAALAFRNTVLAAWRDVDDALTAYADDQAQRLHSAKAVTEDQRALGAAEQSFASGATDFLDVMAAEQALLVAEDQLTEQDTGLRIDLVDLFKALGGGWEVADPTSNIAVSAPTLVTSTVDAAQRRLTAGRDAS